MHCTGHVQLYCLVLQMPIFSWQMMQVLAIVLGNSNSGISTGLFFPEGVVGSNPLYTTVS